MRKGFSLPTVVRWAFFACIAGPALIVACLTILIFCGTCFILRKDPLDYIHIEGVHSATYLQRLSRAWTGFRRLFRSGWKKTNIQ
ncbi:MAG: hypothetical protein KBC50_03065 [Candidatus Pacebacteria bacterium]|nr:hypothetical protein [Candidatus Paceibacterota bacterium]